MATLVPSDQAADLLQKLSLDSQPKAFELAETTQKASVDSGNAANGQRSVSPLVAELVDPSMCYVPTAYYYGGYDGDDFSRYVSPQGLDLSSGVYGGMYHGYAYEPCGPYSPAHPPPYFPSSVASVDKGNTNSSAPVKPSFDAPLFSDWQPRPATGTALSSPVSNANSRNQTYRPNSHCMGLHHPRPLSAMNHGFMNRMYPNKLYGHYGNAIRSGMGFGYDGYDPRTGGRTWLAVDGKFKPRGRSGGYYGYGNENMDGLNELNRGPRAKGSKNQKDFASPTLPVKGQIVPTNAVNDKEADKTLIVPDKDQYNKADFPEEYADAKFFIIKSYSEDDVHKSIKYNVWASTPNGNKKLHAAYQAAQEKCGGCPVFLLFSVNTSGQFVGLAEMVGPVDFNKSVEYWQQDKWNGCFPVKWHIVKDVPNSLLKHITLENNENKPVTNSRDTQEVKLEPGLKLIKIFKEHYSKTCILDDFGFYETRQQTIQEKKAKQQQFQKQVWEGKPVDEKKEVAQDAVAVGENGNVGEKGLVGAAGDAPKGAEPAVVANGVANGC